MDDLFRDQIIERYKNPHHRGTDLAPVARALEDPRQHFLLGVQWHPEGLWQKEISARKLFKSLIAAAGR